MIIFWQDLILKWKNFTKDGVKRSKFLIVKDHFQFAQNFSDDVKNWFVIGKILGPNPIDLRNTEQPSIPEEYSDHPLILEYKIVKEKLISDYQNFGEQYVYKTKPVDGRFKQLFDIPLPDQSKLKKVQNSKEDPLLKWRKIQEERVKRQEKERFSVCNRSSRFL